MITLRLTKVRARQCGNPSRENSGDNWSQVLPGLERAPCKVKRGMSKFLGLNSPDDKGSVNRKWC